MLPFFLSACRIAPRWFVLRDVHAGETVLMQPRYAMSMLRGPMTRSELVAFTARQN